MFCDNSLPNKAILERVYLWVVLNKFGRVFLSTEQEIISMECSFLKVWYSKHNIFLFTIFFQSHFCLSIIHVVSCKLCITTLKITQNNSDKSGVYELPYGL